MIERTRLVPLDSMAFELAQHRRDLRADEAAAALILSSCRYTPAEIAAGLSYAMEKADEIAAAAASNARWAVMLGHARDLAATLVILVGGAYLWAFVA